MITKRLRHRDVGDQNSETRTVRSRCYSLRKLFVVGLLLGFGAERASIGRRAAVAERHAAAVLALGPRELGRGSLRQFNEELYPKCPQNATKVGATLMISFRVHWKPLERK